MPVQRSRPGLTLLELLLIVGIITLLIALILPAIQRAREAANRLVCAQHLRQLGLAAHLYASDHGCLPPGYLGPLGPPDSPGTPAMPYDASRGPWVGALYFLLPYVEMEAVYHNLYDTPQVYPSPPAGYTFDPKSRMNVYQAVARRGWWANGLNVGSGIFQVKIGVFLCPSAELTVPTLGMGGMFTDGPWSSVYLNLPTSIPLGGMARTHYTGVAGFSGTSDPGFEGALTNRSRTRLGQIVAADGTSNTILFGEALGGSLPGKLDRETSAFSWVGVGSLNTKFGLIRVPDSEALPDVVGAWKPWSALAFSAVHPRGTNMCFADGSVRQLRYSKIPADYVRPASPPKLPHPSDWGVLQALAGWRDGSSVLPDNLE